MPVYLEKAEENPHLEPLLRGSADFDAFANQQWFLDRMKDAIERADQSSPLALDQNPVAIVAVYGKLFRSENLIDDAQFKILESKLESILFLLGQWPGGFHTVHLDASPEILHFRVFNRQDGTKPPPADWYGELRIRFFQAFSHIENYETVDTSLLDREEVFSKVSRMLEKIVLRANE